MQNGYSINHQTCITAQVPHREPGRVEATVHALTARTLPGVGVSNSVSGTPWAMAVCRAVQAAGALLSPSPLAAIKSSDGTARVALMFSTAVDREGSDAA